MYVCVYVCMCVRVCVCVCRGEGLRAPVRLQGARAPLCGEHEGQRPERPRPARDLQLLAQPPGETPQLLLLLHMDLLQATHTPIDTREPMYHTPHATVLYCLRY